MEGDKLICDEYRRGGDCKYFIEALGFIFQFEQHQEKRGTKMSEVEENERESTGTNYNHKKEILITSFPIVRESFE